MPIVERVCGLLSSADLLFVGDSKMSALFTRAFIHARAHHYLTPLCLVGTTAKQMPIWIATARMALQARFCLVCPDTEEAEALWEEGYEFTRECAATVTGEAITWTERVLMVYSRSYKKTLARGLQKRLVTATANRGFR